MLNNHADTPRPDDNPTTPYPIPQPISLDEIGEMVHHLTASGERWREEEYQVESIRQHFRLSVMQERWHDNPDEQIAAAPGVPPQAPQSIPTQAILQRLHRLFGSHPGRPLTWLWKILAFGNPSSDAQPRRSHFCWQQMVVLVIFVLGNLGALTLGVSRVVTPSVFGHHLTPPNLTLATILGVVEMVIGYILFGLSMATEQDRFRWKKWLAQIGLFIAGASITVIASSVLRLDPNSFIGLVSIFSIGAGCSAACAYMGKYLAQVQMAVHLVIVSCLLCGMLLWAVPMGALLSHSMCMAMK